MDMDHEVLDGFIIESREHLNAVEDELLQLEKKKDNQKEDSINTIFRGIHTIKGGAGFLGIDKVNSLSHVMETLLSMARSHEITPDEKVVDSLLEGVDILRAMLDNITNQHTVDISAITLKLENLIKNKASLEVQTDLKTEVPLIAASGKASPFTISEFQQKQLKTGNYSLYLLRFDLNHLRKTSNKSPIALINEILVLGDILDARLDVPIDNISRSLKDVPLLYEVLFASQLTAQQIMPVLGLDKDHIEEASTKPTATPTPVSQPQPSPQESTVSTEEPPVSLLPEQIPDTTEEKMVSQRESEPGEISSPTLEKSSTVRINVDLLDRLMNLAGELVLVRNQQLNNLDNSNPILKSITQRLDIVTTEMQELIMLTRMQPIGTILGKYPRFVRELSRKLEKSIELNIIGSEVELDRTILESLSDPLTHIIRNCCDHGIESPDQRKKNKKPETGTIYIRVFHEAGQVNIEIRDDGQGIELAKIKKKAIEKGIFSEDELSRMNQKELFMLLTHPGFSTAEKVSEVSGRGVGLDVVKSNIEKLNGSIDIKSTTGKGTTLMLKLPLTLAIIPSLIVRVGNDRFAIPQVNLEELVALYDEDAWTRIECAEERELFRLRDRLLPLVRLDEVLAHPSTFTLDTRTEITERHRKLRESLLVTFSKKDGYKLIPESSRTLSFAVLKVGKERFGLIIDKVLGTEEIVVKPMHSILRLLKCYAGATVMGDGQVALILDVEGIANHSGILSDFERDLEIRKAEKEKKDALQAAIEKLLLFKSGKTEQFALNVQKIRRIEEIKTSNIECIGDKEFITISGVSTPIIRLHYHFSVSKIVEREHMFLLIPKESPKPCGILVSELVDILETPVQLNVDSFKEEGLLGSAIIHGKMTLFPNLEWLANHVDHPRQIPQASHHPKEGNHD